LSVRKPKKHYLVLECSGCRRFLLATSDKKTRTCPYCGKRVSLENARVFIRSEKAADARMVLQEMKMGEHAGKPG